MASALKRRDLTIVALDMVGYSALMESAEVETHILSSRALDRADSLATRAGGWCLQQATGDGQLYAFTNANSAIAAMMAFQNGLAQRPFELSNGERLVFRIGVHRGSVLSDQVRSAGNAVNFASRLQSVAEPGSLLISGAVFRDLSESSRYFFAQTTPPDLKNVRHQEKVFVWKKTTQVFHVIPDTQTTRTLPETLAILPLRTRSCSRLDYRATRLIADQLASRLSRFEDLDIYPGQRLQAISRNVDAFHRLCRLEGIDHVVELNPNTLPRGTERIWYRLRNVHSGQILVSDHMPSAHVPLAARKWCEVAVGLWSILHTFRVRRRSPTNPITIADRFQLGRHLVRSGNKRALLRGSRLLRTLTQQTPSHTLAWIELSHAYQLLWRFDEDGSQSHLLQAAIEILEEILLVDPEHSGALRELGYALLFQKRTDEALVRMESARRKNPLDILALSNLAEGYAFVGDATRALAFIKRSLALDTRHYKDWRLWSMADAQFIQQDYAGVLKTVGQMNDQTEGLRLKAASEALLDDHVAAQLSTQRILNRTPNFSVENWRSKQPDSDPGETDRYCDALIKAGLPH